MTPEEKLKRQSAIARSQSLTRRTKLYKKGDYTNATVIGYNADIGANVIQLLDGSISYAGSDTNGAMAIGSAVPLHGGTGNIDGLPSIKTRHTLPTKKPLFVSASIAVLFYTVAELSSTRKEFTFYLGGIFETPLKITSMISNLSVPLALANIPVAMSIFPNGKLVVEIISYYVASRFGDINDTFDLEHDFYILNNKNFVKTHYAESFPNEWQPNQFAPVELSVFNQILKNSCVRQFVRGSEVVDEQIVLNTVSIYKNKIYIVQNINLESILIQDSYFDLQVLKIINNSSSSSTCEYTEGKTYKRIKCFGLQSIVSENKRVISIIGWLN